MAWTPSLLDSAAVIGGSVQNDWRIRHGPLQRMEVILPENYDSLTT